jgi:hypothetical protein
MSLVLAVLAASSPAETGAAPDAAEPSAHAGELRVGWDMNLSWSALGSTGFGGRMGDVVTHSSEWETGLRDDGLPFTNGMVHDSREAIGAAPGSRGALEGSVAFRCDGPWGYRLSAVWLDTRDEASGTIETSYSPRDPAYTSSHADFWGQPEYGLLGHFDGDTLTRVPMSYSAERGLTTWRAAAGLLRRLHASPSSRLELALGVAARRLEATNGLNLEKAEGLLGSDCPVCSFDPGLIGVVHRYSESEAILTALGPSFGLELERRWRGVGLHAELTQDVVVGRVKRSGRFDSIESGLRPAYGSLPPSGDGIREIRSTDTISDAETRVIPITQLRARLDVPVAPGLAIQAEGALAAWWWTPDEFRYHAPDYDSVFWSSDEAPLQLARLAIGLRLTP